MKHPISQLVLLIGVALFGMHASAGEGSCDPGIAKKAFAKCASCHTAEEGGATLLGPNLHGVIGRASASVEGFPYSPDMLEYQKTWTEAELHTFLESPMTVVPGTMMAFGGLRKQKDRDAVICHLRGATGD